MGTIRIKLRCMTGGGLSPGAETINYLEDNTNTYVLLHDSQGFQCTSNLDEYNSDDVEVLAKLTKHSFSVLLEPVVDGIAIEPGHSPSLARLGSAKIGIPLSSDTVKHFVLLRPDDIINFSQDGLKIAVMAEILGSSPQPSSDANIIVADPHQGDVQVKSSNADPSYGEGDDATDTSDDDLDQMVRPPAVGEITPTHRAEQSIMETPQGHAPTSRQLNEDTRAEQVSSQTLQRSADNGDSSSPDPGATSEPLQPPEVALIAAAGSTGSNPTKRKIAAVDEDENGEDDAPTRSKRSKVMEEPNSSPAVVVTAQRSTRKQVPTSMSPPSSATSSVLTGKIPNILLSNDSPCRKGTTATFLKKQGATIIDDVKARRSNFVCVLNGDKITTTAKVLRSLALGKLVVTEDWINESKKAGKFLDPDDFVHEELKSTIYIDRRAIFHNTNLFFTDTLAKAYGKGWKDIQELAKEAGASHIEQGNSGDFGAFKDGRMDVICFGQAKNDLDVQRLKKTHGVKVYHKNLLTESIRKGELDLDGEEHVLSG